MSGSDVSPIAVTLAEKLGADGARPRVLGSTELDLQIHAEPAAAETARDRVVALGGTVESTYDDMVWASLEAGSIATYAHGPGVRKVEERPVPMEHSVSEGVSVTNAADLHNLGEKGQGVTVAVIDIYFNPDQSEIQDQVIDTIGKYDGRGPGFQSGTPELHGTACAEIVAEMAPEADLILASVADLYPLANLMDDITSAHEPEVMTMSLGYKPTIRLDGKDSLSSRITEYTSGSGANTSQPGLFAVSAGNEGAGSHWHGQWSDYGNGYLDFGGTDYLPVHNNDSGNEVVVQTDADWSTDQGYSIEVYSDTTASSLVSDPARDTTPAQAVAVPDNSTSYIRIKNESLDGSESFDVFTWGNYINFGIWTGARSLGIPATSPDSNTLSTAAVQHDTNELEDFSSRGPTQDGRRGVDVAAPDDTLSDTYGGEFPGTSAACPHVAGGCALVFGATHTSNGSVRQAVFDTGRAISGDEQGGIDAPGNSNTEIGFGYLDVQAARDQFTFSIAGDTASAGGSATLSITASDIDSITIEDLWTDWTIDSSDPAGGTLTDNISSQGSVTISWNSTQSSVSPSLTLDLPPRYVGGTYLVTGSGARANGTVGDDGLIEVQ